MTKTVQHPRNPNRSSGRSLFLASPLIKQLNKNCTDEPAYSITSDHNLKQFQIELQDQTITINPCDLQHSHDKPRGIQNT